MGASNGDKHMLKIKTITCHNVYNAGASLQAYALFAYLQQLGHDVEIIDYRPVYLKHYKLWGVDNPAYDKPLLREAYNILKLPRRLIARREPSKKRFDAFTQQFLKLTGRTYHNASELSAAPPSADVYIAGSDQIWNTLFPNGRDPAFYLTFAPEGTVRASYAASFATDHIEDDCIEQVNGWLQKFDYISVRESTGVELAKSLGVKCSRSVDPVFLLPKEAWEKMAVQPSNAESYILMYDFDQNEELLRTARKFASEHGWKLWSVFPHSECDRCLNDVGPLEFLGLVQNAQMVFSNSFHATAFSMIFERPFQVFDRKENINTRMRDLLSSVGINGNGVSEFSDINGTLQKQIVDSKNYIQSVLEAAGGAK